MCLEPCFNKFLVTKDVLFNERVFPRIKFIDASENARTIFEKNSGIEVESMGFKNKFKSDASSGNETETQQDQVH